MAVLPILRWPDPQLSAVCDPVVSGDDCSHLIEDIFETMYHAPGRGLAAPQVGVLKRLFVVDVTWKDGTPSPMAFVNPHIVEQAETRSDGEEACLSIPGITTTINRPDWVVMAWTSPDGTARTQRFESAAARCVQHELDHLNGIVTLQHLDVQARSVAEASYSSVAP